MQYYVPFLDLKSLQILLLEDCYSEMNFNSLTSRILHQPFESGQEYMTLYDY